MPPVNKLTGVHERLPPPKLFPFQRRMVKAIARAAKGSHVRVFGREYWADGNGAVFVVAWEDESFFSGDPIE